MSPQFEATLFFIFNHQFPIVGQNRDFAVIQKQKMPSVSRGHSHSFNKSFLFWFLRLSKEPPNPFPKQTHTKTHAGANIVHNL
jgi:hypothetical protein